MSTFHDIIKIQPQTERQNIMKHNLVAINNGEHWLTTIADIDTLAISDPKQWVATQSITKLSTLDDVLDLAYRLDAYKVMLWDDGWNTWTKVEA